MPLLPSYRNCQFICYANQLTGFYMTVVSWNEVILFFIYLFFYEKILRAQKHSEANINQQNNNKLTLNNKGNNFSHAQTSKRVKVACFAFWCFLCARNLFVKKIINRLEIALIASFHYATNTKREKSTMHTSYFS